MPLFQKKENMTEEEKKLSVVVFWLFVVAVFAWVISFTSLYVIGSMNQAAGIGTAVRTAFMPSLIIFVVTAVLCVIVYFVYKKFVVKV